MHKNKPIHLLLDGDISYHKAGRSKNPDGSPLSFAEATKFMNEHIKWLVEHLNADKITVVLSGPSEACFRKKLYEPYKSDRSGFERPQLLDDLKQYLIDSYETKLTPGLEADDILGIMSTEPQDEETRIIVSIDKDLQQIPGFLFNQTHWKDGVQTIDKKQADLVFYSQWLTGDSTDSYPGVPGVGPKKVERIIEQVRAERDACNKTIPWRNILERIILETYERYQLTPSFALTQARLARILRHGDFEDNTVKLWKPWIGQYVEQPYETFKLS